MQIFVMQRRLNRCYVATSTCCDWKLQFVSLLSEPPRFWVISHLFSNLFVQEQPWSDSMWQRTEGASDPLSQHKTWPGYTLTHQANTYTHTHTQTQTGTVQTAAAPALLQAWARLQTHTCTNTHWTKKKNRSYRPNKGIGADMKTGTNTHAGGGTAYWNCGIFQNLFSHGEKEIQDERHAAALIQHFILIWTPLITCIWRRQQHFIQVADTLLFLLLNVLLACPVTLTALCDGSWITLQSNVLSVTWFLPVRCIDTVGADSRSSIVHAANSAPRRAKPAPLICVMYVMCEDRRRTVFGQLINQLQ